MKNAMMMTFAAAIMLGACKQHVADPEAQKDADGAW